LGKVAIVVSCKEKFSLLSACRFGRCNGMPVSIVCQRTDLADLVSVCGEMNITLAQGDVLDE
jgi:hypothetical protein